MSHSRTEIHETANALLGIYDSFIEDLFSYAERRKISAELMRDALLTGYSEEIAESYMEAVEAYNS